MEKNCILIWLRRDLRLQDNAAINQALQTNMKLLFYFNFDTEILDQLEDRKDARINYIHSKLQKINLELSKIGSRLLVKYGSALHCISEVLKEYPIANIYANEDYEPFAIARDQACKDLCESQQVGFQLYKDQVIFKKKEILKKDGTPYTVYTPYMKKWRSVFNPKEHLPYSYELDASNTVQMKFNKIPSLADIGFSASYIDIPAINLSMDMLSNYDDRRNFPALKATSNLGIHLRFGTISIRQAVREALKGDDQFLFQLIWREFFMQILVNFPRVEQECFKPSYNQIQWVNNEEEFELWTNGMTGFPIVDAGMRELKATGNLHNRVRMIVASFLVKDLLIDWRWGEAWFANYLLDYDQAANNGNWQWVAGCGCDAAPYFRVFNPSEQQKKFDPDFAYIKKWIPDLGTDSYPKPMIDHKFARNRALESYKSALQRQGV
ncbi:cryptochrome/photolyase family protein [Marinifilum sp.]|uniref:cryptochrome/photolyase family protein n=1 Tax=Marinifilum sp. TaxID=2033137 RepID=UPI003BA8BD12